MSVTWTCRRARGRLLVRLVVLIAVLAPAAPGWAGDQIQVPTTLEDFFQPGTQPSHAGEVQDIIASPNCAFCHSQYMPDPADYSEPWDGWSTSVKAQSARDPVWHAALTIANQDANMSGEYCIRCHAPGAWLGGRSTPPDASGFISDFFVDDHDGVTCNFCHRAVDPLLGPESPPEDAAILAALDFPPGAGRGNGRYVVDPDDARRGPYDDVPQNLHAPVPIIHSPFHRESEMCATCHDVGNPAFDRMPDGSYVLNELDMQHPTQNPHGMFPEQRTYSEWLNSTFAQGGVLFEDGRFGGEHPTGLMQSCQDCHMPDVFSGACFAYQFEPFFPRDDIAHHSFAGANTWLLDAIVELEGGLAGVTPEALIAAKARTVDMLRAASDVQLQQLGPELKVRVINYSGHKLPTGYPEGRRMWLNVQYLDETEQLIGERGAYDAVEAELTEDTKVYGMSIGIGEDIAAATGLPVGKTFRLVLANEVLSDNRIPAMGFENATYDTFGGAPVAYVYEDGQYWDDTLFEIPEGAVSAVVTLYYQSMTKEYIEFLRDENVTNDRGDVVYALWDDPDVGNRVPPVDMDTVIIDLTPPALGDADGDGMVTFMDILQVLSAWGPCPPPDLCPADVNGDSTIDVRDLFVMFRHWG